MGQVHNEIRKGTLSEAVQRALGVTRSEGGVERFGETIQPIMHPWGLPEWAYLRKEKLCAISRVAAPVAGEFGYSAIINPANSELIAVIETVGVQPGAVALNVTLQMQTEAAILSTLTVASKGNVRDRRWPQPFSLCDVASGTDVSSGIGVTLEIGQVPVIQTWLFAAALPIVLTPGWGVLAGAQTVNVQIVVNFGWRERQAYPGELV